MHELEFLAVYVKYIVVQIYKFKEVFGRYLFGCLTEHISDCETILDNIIL